jgi:aminoglycoside phosphotransferase (APT) family kinase protein
MMPQPAYMWSAAALVTAARLIRRYHDAVEGFLPPDRATWQVQVGAPAGGPIICHNDLAPWNTVFVDKQPTGLIDWDFAAPGTRLWDVAYALWRWVPVYPPWKCGVVGSPVPDYGRRARLFLDAYGLEDRSEVVATMRQRMLVLSKTIRTWGKAGTPGFAALLAKGYDKLPLQDLDVLEARCDDIERAVLD